MKRTYSLDNSAKLYPAVTKKTNTCVFRVSAIMTETVDPDVLQQAAEIVIKRFPTMAVKLREGLFWAYFQENDNPLVVREETAYPCASIIRDKKNNEYLFRIMYYGRRISLECFHSLTDGMGAIEFLKTLLYQYLLLTGKEIYDEGMILLPESTPSPEEAEDGSLRYYQKHVKKVQYETQNARTIKGTVYKDRRTNVIHGIIPAASLNAYARRNGTTITGYLSSVFAQAISSSASQQGQSHLPVQIGIPVNLRGMFPSKTLRNFVSQINVKFPTDSGQTFDELMESATTQMKTAITEENLSGMVATFVGYEKMLAGRIVPWFIKKVVIDLVTRQTGRATTALLSNLGNVKLPKSMAQYIDVMEAVSAPKKTASINSAICSVNDKLNISFSGNIHESDVVERFFALIAEQTKLEVEVYSNGWIETNARVDRQSLYPAYTAAKPELPQTRPGLCDAKYAT